MAARGRWVEAGGRHTFGAGRRRRKPCVPGVGAALMGAAEAWAREVGAGSVHLATGAQRRDAHRFCERLGCEGTGLRYLKPLG